MKLPQSYALNSTTGKIDMTLSENPLGCSPLVEKSLRSLTVNDVSRYPDSVKLTRAIAKFFKVSGKSVVVGTGSEQLIKLIAQTFMPSKRIALIQQGSFSLFSKEVLLAGGRVILASPEKIIKMKVQKVKLIFLCNPNNPTGELIPPPLVKTIMSKFSKAVVVLDEVNGEFTDNSMITEAVNRDNVIILKSFSKGFGLAGLRVGFAIGAGEPIKKLKEIQQVFPVSAITCKLSLAALKDPDFLDQTRCFVNREKDRMVIEIEKLGLTVKPSVTNNLFIMSDQTEKLIEVLSQNGVAVISGAFSPGMTTPGFRIAIRDSKINQIFIEKLKLATACLGSKKLIPSSGRKI